MEFAPWRHRSRPPPPFQLRDRLSFLPTHPARPPTLAPLAFFVVDKRRERPPPTARPSCSRKSVDKAPSWRGLGEAISVVLRLLRRKTGPVRSRRDPRAAAAAVVVAVVVVDGVVGLKRPSIERRSSARRARHVERGPFQRLGQGPFDQ